MNGNHVDDDEYSSYFFHSARERIKKAMWKCRMK